MKEPTDRFEAYFNWEKDFLKNVGVDYSGKFYQTSLPAAQRAWKRLAAAHLCRITVVILYQCHAFGSSVPAEFSKKQGEVIRRIQALKRAEKVARERKDDPRTQMFTDRTKAARKNAGNAEWPSVDPNVNTLADAALVYPIIGALPLERAPAVLGVARQNEERFEAKTLLAVLVAGAKGHGVRISLMELAELWDAAGQPRDSDVLNRKNTLQRFFEQPSVHFAKYAYQKWFEEWLRQMRNVEKSR